MVDELGIPGMKGGDPQGWGIPRVTQLVGGYSAIGNDSSNPFILNDAVFQGIDNFFWMHGAHSVRFGGEIRRDRYNQRGTEFARGSFEFNGQYSGDSVNELLVGALSKGEYALNLAFGQWGKITTKSTNMRQVQAALKFTF